MSHKVEKSEASDIAPRLAERTAVLAWGSLLLASAVFGQDATRVVSAASQAPVMAPGSIGSVFGSGLTVDILTGQPDRGGLLPTVLAGVQVELNGRAAQLLYAAPGQINFVVPSDTELGQARAVVRTSSGTIVTSGEALIQRVAPAIFTAPGEPGGSGAILNASTAARGPFSTASGIGGEPTKLSILCTGIRGYSKDDASPRGPVSITVHASTAAGASWELRVDSVGLSTINPALDEVRVVVPPDMDFNGTLTIVLSAGDSRSNAVTVEIRSQSMPEVTSVMPPSVRPGASIRIAGRRFAFGERALTRNGALLITETGLEIPVQPSEATADSISVRIPGFGSADPDQWYRGTLQACVTVDDRRVCSSQPFQVLPAAKSGLPPGQLLLNRQRALLASAVEAYRAADLADTALLLETSGLQSLDELTRRVQAAVRGTPERFDHTAPDGTVVSASFDLDALRRIEAVLAADDDPMGTAKTQAKAAAARQVLFGCYSQQELNRIVARVRHSVDEAAAKLLGRTVITAYTAAALGCLSTLAVPNPSCLVLLPFANLVSEVAGLIDLGLMVDLAIIEYGGRNYLYSSRVAPQSVDLALGQTSGFNVIGEFGPVDHILNVQQAAAKFATKALAEGIPWEKFPANVQSMLTGPLKEAVQGSLEAGLTNFFELILRPLKLNLEFNKVPVLLSGDSFVPRPNGDEYASFETACRPDAGGKSSSVTGRKSTSGSRRTYIMEVKDNFLIAAGAGAIWPPFQVGVSDGQLTTDRSAYVEGQSVQVTGKSFPPNVTITLHAPFPILLPNFVTASDGTFQASVPIPYTYCDSALMGGVCGDAVISTNVPGTAKPIGTLPFRVRALTPSVTTGRTLYKSLQQVTVFGRNFPQGYSVQSRVILEGREIGANNSTSGSFSYSAAIPDKLTGAGGVLTIVQPRGWRLVSQFFVAAECGLDAEGLCKNPDPTFIQPPKPHVESLLRLPARTAPRPSAGLVAEIQVPRQNSLVRASIPIFGKAHGTAFREYQLEVGAGTAPTEWTLLKSSYEQQKDGVTREAMADSADLTIIGNLANWDTGLKNYVYLPSYPKDHPVDLKGIYTLRLLVSGKDGSQAEDRVVVNVGEVIANASGGVVTSDDGRARLRFPEHALTDSFVVFSLRAVGPPNAPAIPKDILLIGSVYEAREPGDEFTVPVPLEIQSKGEAMAGVNPDSVGIYGYDTVNRRWNWLASVRDGHGSFSTYVTHLSPWYALMASPQKPNGSRQADPLLTKINGIPPPDGQFLVREDFEHGVGRWSSRYGDYGASAALDSISTFDGSHCLRITSSRRPGNFGITAFDRSYDVSKFPIIEFDYRLPPGVGVDLYAKVSGRWYVVRFTGQPDELKYKRVNIAPIGRVENVKADDAWHAARLNLYDLLRNKTRNTIVDEIMLADWSVVGTMKLGFGVTAPGSSYFVDNFSIRRDTRAGLRFADDVLILDKFDQKKDSNALGGATTVFDDAHGSSIRRGFAPAPGGHGNVLQLGFAVPRSGGFAGYVTSLEGIDGRDYQSVALRLKTTGAGYRLRLGLRDATGRESKLDAALYADSPDSSGWMKVEVPLTAFAELGDWSRLDLLSISVESPSSASGQLLVDEIRMLRKIRNLSVDRFDDPNANQLRLPRTTIVKGNVALASEVGLENSRRFARITYGGNIGAIRSYGTDRFSYAVWATGVGGMDCSGAATVSFFVRGAEGAERPNIYLDDGNHRWGIDISKYSRITKDWRKVTIPLRDFSDFGVDLSHVEEFQLAFEWEKMSGTVYISDIRFGDDQPLLESVRESAVARGSGPVQRRSVR